MPYEIKDSFRLISISLVNRCPYCRTDDWDKPKTKPNGEV